MIKLKKDRQVSLRMNREIFKELEKLGRTPQQILDEKLEEMFTIKVEGKDDKPKARKQIRKGA